MEQLARFGEPPQYWVWDQIKTYLENTVTTSDTHDLHSLLDQHSLQLQSLSMLFPLEPGQVGAISAVGPNLFIELFGDPEILEDRYDQVLRSALIEAIARPSDEVVPPQRVHFFLDHIVEACQKTRVMNNRSLKESVRSLACRSIRPCPETAPPPLPLNPALHQFFLRLFSRH